MEESINRYEADVLKETVEILKYFDSDFVSKIPVDFLNAIKLASKSSDKEVVIDKTKKLEEQNISEDCKDMISLIYYHYVATKEKREELTKIWTNNEELFQKELKQKYKYENLFKTNKNENIKNEIETENFQMVVIKERNVFQKIIEYIKNFFKV